MRTNLLKSLLVILFFPVVLFSCGKVKSEAIKEEETLPEDIVELRDDQIALAKVELGKIETREIGSSLRVNGVVSAAPGNNATVCMPYGGYVKSTTLLPGDKVSKGQPLAEIENQDFVDLQQSYLESRNKLTFAEADYKRHMELYQNDVYSQQNVQEVTVEYRNLKAQVRSLEEKLRLIGIDPEKLTEDNISARVSLLSPIQGYLKSVNVSIGRNVSPVDVLFEIVNTDKLFLELSLYEKDADKVLPGEKAKFFINNETEEHDALITRAGKSIGDDRTFTAYATVESSCKNLLPGMYVNAVIESNTSKVTALPSDAIVSFDDKDYIFVFEKEKTEMGRPFTEYRIVEVKKGVSSSGYTEIILPEGFDTSAKVVVRGAYNLLSAKKNAGEMAC